MGLLLLSGLLDQEPTDKEKKHFRKLFLLRRKSCLGTWWSVVKTLGSIVWSLGLESWLGN